MAVIGKTLPELLKKITSQSTAAVICCTKKREFKISSRHQELVDEDIPKVRGIDILRDPAYNKGTAFTIRERQLMGIQGLLPPVVFSQDEQAKRVYENFMHWDDDLDKYIYLSMLQDRNEKLFYRIVCDNIETIAPIIYTPTVGRACQNYGAIFRKPKGLYITINDKGHCYDILSNWPVKDVKTIVVTDGERILGLGDLGAYGMGIPVGKLALYTAMGGVPPHQCLPVVIDVGTDNEELLDSQNYIGLKHKRVRGPRYDELIAEFVQAVILRFGQGALIQFEDFANHNAFRLLDEYKGKALTFNDDIQGTASVCVAGLMAAARKTGIPIHQQKYLFLGAGEAATGIATLMVMALEVEGLTYEQATDLIYMVDIDGLLTHGRPKGKIKKEQLPFAKNHKHMSDLEEIAREIKPGVAIGAAAAAGAFTETFLREMASNNKHPIIFALSNPTYKAECTAEQAYKYTDGQCVFASGSPFDPVVYEGKTYYVGQGNNAYIFPGVGWGAMCAGAHFITERTFLEASKTLASMVTDAHLAEDESTHLSHRCVTYLTP